MKFDLKAPCRDCPFRTDIVFYLTEGRVREICRHLIDFDGTFTCHKTTQHDEDGEYIPLATEQHCYGAMVFLMKKEKPNQLMRIAERVGMIDLDEIDLRAPVVDTTEQMVRMRSDKQPIDTRRSRRR